MLSAYKNVIITTVLHGYDTVRSPHKRLYYFLEVKALRYMDINTEFHKSDLHSGWPLLRGQTIKRVHLVHGPGLLRHGMLVGGNTLCLVINVFKETFVLSGCEEPV